MCSPFVFALHVLDARADSESDVQSAELSVTGAQSVRPAFIEEQGGET